MSPNPLVPERPFIPCDSIDMKCTVAGHEAAKTNEKIWLAMEYLGIQDCEEYGLELRNCPCCGSTLAKRIAYSQATER